MKREHEGERHQHIVDHRYRGADPVHRLESESDVDEHGEEGHQGGVPGAPPEFLAHHRPHDFGARGDQLAGGPAAEGREDPVGRLVDAGLRRLFSGSPRGFVFRRLLDPDHDLVHFRPVVTLDDGARVPEFGDDRPHLVDFRRLGELGHHHGALREIDPVTEPVLPDHVEETGE